MFQTHCLNLDQNGDENQNKTGRHAKYGVFDILVQGTPRVPDPAHG